MRYSERLANGVVDSRPIDCPACLGNNVAIIGSDTDGRELVIHFSCNCGAQYVYQYVRVGTETLFACTMVG